VNNISGPFRSLREISPVKIEESKKNRIGFYVVNNSKGQYLGTFRASSPQAAIQAFNDSQAVSGSFFRGQQIKPDKLTATLKEAEGLLQQSVLIKAGATRPLIGKYFSGKTRSLTGVPTEPRKKKK